MGGRIEWSRQSLRRLDPMKIAGRESRRLSHPLTTVSPDRPLHALLQTSLNAQKPERAKALRSGGGEDTRNIVFSGDAGSADLPLAFCMVERRRGSASTACASSSGPLASCQFSMSVMAKALKALS